MKNLILILSLIFSLSVMAQVSINSAGGDGTFGTTTVSYSYGQVFYLEGQGVQHAYEIFDDSTTSINDITLEVSLIAFPNPTTDYLTLKVEDSFDNFSFQLFDMNGRMLDANVFYNETKINMINYQSSTYIVRVFNNENQVVKQFKIIKR